jgi:HTH-type transcriptional regulator / antitoxin MqsA
MNCDVCAAGERRPQLIRYSLSMADSLILVDHVPAEVCDRCGEVTLSPDVVDRLQQTVWNQEPPARVIETPVYEFA